MGGGARTTGERRDSDVIRFENVGLRYGMGPEVLRDLTFQVAPKSFQFLTGPSGAGKTTLIRLFFLALKPTRGLISLFGRDVSSLAQVRAALAPPPHRRRLPGFPPARSPDHVRERRPAAARARPRGSRPIARDVVELLRWVGLGDRMHALPPILSGGEKQRAAIARALITRPEILLADEPTGNVDPPLARRLMRLFVELNRLGTSVVIATHDINLMNQFDARRLVLEEGRLTIYD